MAAQFPYIAVVSPRGDSSLMPLVPLQGSSTFASTVAAGSSRSHPPASEDLVGCAVPATPEPRTLTPISGTRVTQTRPAASEAGKLGQFRPQLTAAAALVALAIVGDQVQTS
jgi:hypothetical protein